MTDGSLTSPEELRKVSEGGTESLPSLKDWEMTDPKHHNPEKFRYIVHALSDDEDLDFSLAMEHYRGGLDSGFPIEHPIDPRVNPKEFLQKKYLSCSLIDQDHQDTTGMTGLILAVPKENILRAHPMDLGTTYNEEVFNLDSDPDLPDAQDILEQTMPSYYNEVLITNTSKTGKKIKYAGAFTFVFAPGKSVRPDLDGKIREFAKKQKIPLIEFS